MATTKVRVQLNSIWTNCTKNNAGKWVCNLAAPDTTSRNLSGGYYPVTVEVTNDAGTVAIYNSASADIGSFLRLVVKETVKPIITLVSPTNGALTTNNRQPITFRVTDETSGSGVNPSTVSLTLGGTVYKQGSPGMAVTTIANGYQFVYTPPTALQDGAHALSITASDYDGNAAAAVSASFTTDTTKPQLDVSSPTAGLITNNPNITLRGTTNDAVSSPVTVTATLNGVSVGAITVNADGSFSKAITLAEGTNTVVVTARDAAGNSTPITRTVKLDTSVPQINSASISPNPANASASIQIILDIT